MQKSAAVENIEEIRKEENSKNMLQYKYPTVLKRILEKTKISPVSNDHSIEKKSIYLSNLFHKNKIFRDKKIKKKNRMRVDATHEIVSSETTNSSNELSMHSYHTDKSMTIFINQPIGQKKSRSDSVISDL